jgi:hypothetical protein
VIEKKSRAWIGHYSIVTLFPNSQLEPDLQPDPESDNSVQSHEIYDNCFFQVPILYHIGYQLLNYLYNMADFLYRSYPRCVFPGLV